MDKKDLKYILTLLPISVFAFFTNIWVRPADLMEARNFITAREMIQNDNFIIPTLNGFLRFEKPPLPTWFTAFIMKITGNSIDEYILRIPVALSGILFVILLYYFVKLFTKDSLKSFITAFVGTTTFMIIKLGNENTWDMYPYVFAFGAVTFIVKGFQSGKIKDFIISGIFIGASVLSKGPVGIYGLMIPFIIAHTAVYGFNDYRKNWKKLILAVLIGISIPGAWFLAVYTKYPEFFLSVLNKEKNTWSTRHTESFIYYMDYFVYMGIWIFFSVMALAKTWNEKRREDKDFSKFTFFWNVLVILFLSFIKMKKKRYGLPIYMTSIINVGMICSYYYDKLWVNLEKSDKILLYIQGIFVALASFALPFIFIKGYVDETVKIWYLAMMFIMFIPFGYVVLRSLFDKNVWTIKLIIFGSGVFMLIANAASNWFLDRTFVRKANEIIEYQKIKLVREAPPAFDIYAENYEIEDVWRIGKQIKNYKKDDELPEQFIFFGNVPEELEQIYSVSKKEIYVKDDGELAELNYLKKSEV